MKVSALLFGGAIIALASSGGVIADDESNSTTLSPTLSPTSSPVVVVPPETSNSPTSAPTEDDDGEEGNGQGCGKCLGKVIPQIVQLKECNEVDDILETLDDCVSDCGKHAEKISDIIESVVGRVAAWKGCDVDIDNGHPKLSCAKCVSKALRQASTEAGEGANPCEIADKSLEIFTECAEDKCEKATNMFEDSVERLKEKLEAKLGDDCEVTPDDFPKLQCANCVAGAMADFIKPIDDTTLCQRAEAATEALKVCNNNEKCSKHVSRVEKALDQLVKRATKIGGEDCKLDVEDLPINKVCGQCVAGVGQQLAAVRKNPPEDVCTFADDLLDSLSNCADVCKVKLDKDAVKAKLEGILDFTGVDCAENTAQVMSFALQTSIELEPLQEDENTTVSPNGDKALDQAPSSGTDPTGPILGGVFGVLVGLGVVYVYRRRKSSGEDAFEGARWSATGADDPSMFYGNDMMPQIEDDDNAMSSDNPMFRAAFEADDDDFPSMDSMGSMPEGALPRQASNPMFDPNDMSTFDKFDL